MKWKWKRKRENKTDEEKKENKIEQGGEYNVNVKERMNIILKRESKRDNKMEEVIRK